ncbi:MAG: ABC transporter permease [Tissierellia bacterium]|nr:ABC transporter permease [Tissierellia bacterium]
MNFVFSSIEQGLIYAVLAMGVYISFKILNIPDMSVEGSFPFGAMITALLLSKGVNPFVATFVAFVAGIIPGIISSTVAIKLKISSLLSGILTMTMFYTLNLKVTGRPNAPMAKLTNIFSYINTGNEYINKIIVLAIIVVVIKLIMDWFFRTKAGYMLISTGDNESLVTSLGESPEKFKIIGLALANSLVALSGSLFAQSVKFADTQMGIGTLVIALASIIIGDTMFRRGQLKSTTMAIIGAIIYKIIGAVALYVGLDASDLKLVNSLIVIIFIAYNNSYDKIRQRLIK